MHCDWEYIGKGAYINYQNVPAADLTAAEVEANGWDPAVLATSGCYRPKPAPDAPAAPAAPAPRPKRTRAPRRPARPAPAPVLEPAPAPVAPPVEPAAPAVEESAAAEDPSNE